MLTPARAELKHDDAVGEAVGCFVGAKQVQPVVGLCVGTKEGDTEGATVGTIDG